MRVSRLVSAPTWRYVAETVFIVVGVTIALAATSWYEGRQERRDESLVLRQLHQTLSEDLQYINTQWEITKQRERRITALLDHLESNEPYAPELARDFQALLGWRTVSIRTAPFEALKVQGYRSISSAMLREQLISFYEDVYEKLEYSSFRDRDLAIEKIQPYFFENFVIQVAASKDVDHGTQDWVPKDYDTIKMDRYVADH